MQDDNDEPIINVIEELISDAVEAVQPGQSVGLRDVAFSCLTTISTHPRYQEIAFYLLQDCLEDKISDMCTERDIEQHVA